MQRVDVQRVGTNGGSDSQGWGLGSGSGSGVRVRNAILLVGPQSRGLPFLVMVAHFLA